MLLDPDTFTLKELADVPERLRRILSDRDDEFLMLDILEKKVVLGWFSEWKRLVQQTDLESAFSTWSEGRTTTGSNWETLARHLDQLASYTTQGDEAVTTGEALRHLMMPHQPAFLAKRAREEQGTGKAVKRHKAAGHGQGERRLSESGDVQEEGDEKSGRDRASTTGSTARLVSPMDIDDV